MPLFYHMERLHTPHNVCMSHFPLDDYTAEQAWDIALMLPTQKQSLLSPSRSAEFLLPETLMWRGIYQAGAQMPNSLPSGSVNCAHLLLGKSDPTSFKRLTGCFDIVGKQDVACEARFVAATLATQAKHEMGLCPGRSYFEPALRFAHGLVINLLKAELIDIEVEGFVLVADTYTDCADFR